MDFMSTACSAGLPDVPPKTLAVAGLRFTQPSATFLLTLSGALQQAFENRVFSIAFH
jgi:hypothetical protein